MDRFLRQWRAELLRLMKQVRRDATDLNHPYTKGYLDALRYCIEWIDEYE